MTPFELYLEGELNVEWQRFANEWLFKWHGMTYEGGVTDVDDFRGGRIHYSGIKFGHQQQQIFWQSIDRYLMQKVHEMFKRWDAETAKYSATIRLTSIDGVERHLRQFVHRIIQHSLQTDRALRGMGYPANVTHYDSSGNVSRVDAEIVRLARAHRALLLAAAAPASDRIVTLDHNSPAYRETEDALEALERALIEANDYPDPEDKQQRIAEVSATRRLLNSTRVRIRALVALIGPGVAYFTTQLGTTAVGRAASAVVDKLIALLGSIF